MTQIGTLFHAFADESGQRGLSAKSSSHFVLSAVIIADSDVGAAVDTLAKLRSDLGRRPGDPLSWKNLHGHAHRLHAARTLGAANFLTISTVVACKRYLPPLPQQDLAYMFTFRFLLERISWFARDRHGVADRTLAHIRGFKLATLRHYEGLLRVEPGTKIAWDALPGKTQIDQPNRLEMLQLGDLAASATAQAFEPDAFGNTEPRYLAELSPRLYRRPPGPLTSYGLKMHPWNEQTKAIYAWVSDL